MFIELDNTHAVIILCRLYDLKKSFKHVFISNARIAKEFSVSTATVKRSLNYLIRRRLITIKNSEKKRIIDLTPSCLKHFEPVDPKKQPQKNQAVIDFVNNL